MPKAFVKLIRNYALRAVLGLSFYQAALVKFVLDQVLPAAVKYGQSVYAYFKIAEAKKVDEKNQEKYDETLKDGVTEAAQDDATGDFLNGRK